MARTPPFCPECEKTKHVASSAIPDADEIPRLESAADRDGFAGLVRETPYRHGSSAELLRARYSLDEEVCCSLPGRHAHNKGVIFETYCGQIISTGMRCGKRDIVGWNSIAGYIEAVDKHASNVSNLGKRPQQHVATLEALRVTVADCERRRDILAHQVRVLSEEMKKRARMKGAARATVSVKHNVRDANGDERSIDREERLAGLEVWARTGMLGKLDGTLRGARQLGAVPI